MGEQDELEGWEVRGWLSGMVEVGKGEKKVGWKDQSNNRSTDCLIEQ